VSRTPYPIIPVPPGMGDLAAGSRSHSGRRFDIQGLGEHPSIAGEGFVAKVPLLHTLELWG
jgi:hypothetical protein